MTKYIIALVALFVLCFAVTAYAENCVPMARKGEIPDNLTLADRLEASLVADSSGKGLVEGANATFNDFFEAMKGAGGTVDSREFLSTYVRSLKKGRIEEGKTYTFSRMCDNDGDGKLELDLEKGFPREALTGEVGWHDANTGRLILAGDCFNSPLRIVHREAPKPVIAVTKHERKPNARSLQFAGNVQIAPPQVGPCVRGRELVIFVYESDAAFLYDENRKEYVGSAGLRKKLDKGQCDILAQQGALVYGPNGESYTAEAGYCLALVEEGLEDGLSYRFGRFLDEAQNAGHTKFDSGTHTISVVAINDRGEEALVYNGEVTGHITIRMPPDFDPTMEHQVRFVQKGTHGEDGRFNVGMFSPLETGIKIPPQPEYCRNVVSAIAGSDAEIVPELYDLVYPPDGNVVYGGYYD